MKKYQKLFPAVAAFLLMFPFRLPISVLLIYAFNAIAQLAGKVVPDDVLCANVVVTKLVYNLVLGSWFVYSIEKGSRRINGRSAKDGSTEAPFYWWSFVIGILTLAYIIYDGVAAYQLFWPIIGKSIPS